jgi:hypothetical protein
MFLYYRSQDVLGDPYWKGKKRPSSEKRFFKAWISAVTRAWLWNLGIRMVRPLINKDAHDGVISKMKGPFQGWFRTRDLPAMAKKTFHDRWKEIKSREA